jgi:probable rRNA maturation factor
LPAAERLARVAEQVLRWEGARTTRVEVTLLGAAAMRRMNRRVTGRRGLTDVLAFGLPHPDGRVLGDVYICRAAAVRYVAAHRGAEPQGRGRGAVDEELVRLAVHGTLHVLGYDHPEGAGRMRSAMWRRQERYVDRLKARGVRAR